MNDTTRPDTGDKTKDAAKLAAEKNSPLKAAIDAVDAAEKAERFIPAQESRFTAGAEYREPLVHYIPEAGTPFEHLLRPQYWASIKQLRAGCHIYVQEEAGAYWAELFVLKAGQGFAKVQVFRHIALEGATADPAVPDGYEIQFRGPIVKHRVVRIKDGTVLKQNIETQEEAQAWLRDHKKMLAA